MNLTHSGHFVPTGSVPVFDDATPLNKVLDQLGAMGVSGFLVREHGQPTSYIKGFELAQKIVDVVRDAPQQRLDILNQQPIREVIATFAKSVTVPVSILEPERAVTEHELQNQPDRVFGVVAAQGAVGWYLNHEDLLATLTPKPLYHCKRGHKNGSWNNGRCKECPAALVAVTK